MENEIKKEITNKVLLTEGDYEFAGNLVKSFEFSTHVEDEINAYLAEVKKQNILMTIDNMINVGNRILIVLNKWEKKNV